MSFQNLYAEMYDSIHFDKNYDLEVKKIISLVSEYGNSKFKILDFCGFSAMPFSAP